MISKRIFIMGDSYSTYGGYIPEDYLAYYSDDRQTAPIVSGVDKTWWKILEQETQLQVVLNDSYSGSTVCNSVREGLPLSSSFVRRMDHYLSEDYFAANRIDTLIIFGGTNDSWLEIPLGHLTYSDWTQEDLLQVLPAFCYLLAKATTNPLRVIVIINSELNPQLVENLDLACAHYGVECVHLEDIDKENSHPTELGMVQIAQQVCPSFRNQ